MTPLLVLVGSVVPAGFIAMATTSSLGVQVIIALTIFIVVSATLLAYAYWAKNDPNRLGSDHFVAHQSIMAAIQQDARDPTMLLEADALEPTTKPVGALEDRGGA